MLASDPQPCPNPGRELPIGRLIPPGLLRAVDCSNPVGFAAKRAESLLFAGAHLHSTLPQETGRTRFSLDFRIVHLDDHNQGRGAPSVDDRSRGSALRARLPRINSPTSSRRQAARAAPS